MSKRKYARLAAALTALIITGAGWLPAQAAYHEWSTDEKNRGNLMYEFTENSSPNLSYAYSNVFIGDSWAVNEARNNFLFGDGENQTWNLSFADDSIVFGDNVNLQGNSAKRITNAFIVGDNVSFNNVNTGTVIGNDNKIWSVDNSMIIGDRVNITNNKDAGGNASGISVIGNDVNVRTAGDNITVIGDIVNVDTMGTRTNSSNSLIYGNNVTMTNSQNSVAMGNNITMTGSGTADDDNVAIGHGISLGQTGGKNSSGTVAMGDHISVNGADNVVLGGDIDLGDSALNDVVVIGHRADTTGVQSVTIGEGASSGTSGTAVGGESKASGNAAAFGFQAIANADETTVIGPYSTVDSSYSAALDDHVTIGNNSIGSVSVGAQSSIGDNANYAIAIGGSGGGTGSPAEERTTIGNGATASIAMGYGASISDNSSYSLAMGAQSTVSSQKSVAMGYLSSIGNNSNFSTALGGQEAVVNATGGTALGSYTQVNAEKSIAVGYGSRVLASDILSQEDVNEFIKNLNEDTLGLGYNDAYNIQFGDTNGVFSVGEAGSPRRIINVARGRISENSTDAVNGSQLYGAVKYLEGKIDEAGGGGDVSIGGDDNITVTDTTPTTPDAGEGSGTTGSEGGTTVPGGETGGSTTEPGGGSTGGTTGGAGSGSEGQSFTVNMSDNPVFGGHNDGEPGHSADGSVSVVDSTGTAIDINKDKSGGISIASGGNSIKINEGNSGGISITDSEKNSI